MGLSSLTRFEVRTTGSDTLNSGGFRVGAWIAAPAAPTVTPSGSGGTVAAGIYYVVVTYTDPSGDTVMSSQTAVTTSGATASFTVTSPPAITYALKWNCYVGTAAGGPYFPQGTALTIGSNRIVTTTPPTTGTQSVGVDYSQQDVAQVSVADGVANGTTTVTSATANFTGAHVGNVVKIATSFYDIVGVTNSTTIVVDRTITTGTALALVVGGAFASHGQVMATTPVGANIVFVKNGSYAIGAGTVNTSGNKISDSTGLYWIGYSTNRSFANTDASRPTLDCGANSQVVFTMAGSDMALFNHNFTNTVARTGATAILVASQRQTVRNCRATSYNIGIDMNSPNNVIKDVACVSCATGINANGGTNHILRAYVKAATTAGITAASSAGSVYQDCVVAGTTGTAVVNWNLSGSAQTFLNCVSYKAAGTGSNGVNMSSGVSNLLFQGFVSWGHAQYDFNAASNGRNSIQFHNCCAGGSGTAIFQEGGGGSGSIGTNQVVGLTTLTVDPFTNGAADDFSLNTTAGGGAAVRGLGVPGVTDFGTGYRDGGPLQHADPATPPIQFAWVH